VNSDSKRAIVKVDVAALVKGINAQAQVDTSIFYKVMVNSRSLKTA